VRVRTVLAAALVILVALAVPAAARIDAGGAGRVASRSERFQLPDGFRPAVTRMDRSGRYFVQLKAPSVLERGRLAPSAQRAAMADVLRSQAAAVREAQSMGGTVIFRYSRLVNAFSADPLLPVYGATKAAVLQLTKSLAAENKRYVNVSVHALLPGMVETDFYGPRMRVSPELEASARNIPWVLRAIGVPKREVGELAATIAAQTPGRETGRIHRTVRGLKTMRGVARLIGYRMSGRITDEP
jgi:NAD(P)-dependent dehydrogenase (short-subunit alcohol dehydrogenase family)